MKVKSYEGIVRDMDISHMHAAIEFNYQGDTQPWAVKVGRIYDLGDKVKVYDISNLPTPWFLQGVTFVDENPISEAECFRSY